MIQGKIPMLIAMTVLLVPATVFVQERVAGTAIVRVADNEYTIPIECNDASRPELGFSTEPGRITRERNGRTSGVRLTLRPWQETNYLVISLDRYVAWVPSQPSVGGILRMTLDMSPVSSQVDGVPEALTYDEWMAGNHPAGLEDATFEANCRERNPDAPAFRKIKPGS